MSKTEYNIAWNNQKIIDTLEMYHGDPPDGPPYFVKKTFPPECWDPPATSSHARKCVTVGTHLVEAYVALSF